MTGETPWWVKDLVLNIFDKAEEKLSKLNLKVKAKDCAHSFSLKGEKILQACKMEEYFRLGILSP